MRDFSRGALPRTLAHVGARSQGLRGLFTPLPASEAVGWEAERGCAISEAALGTHEWPLMALSVPSALAVMSSLLD